MQGLRRGFCKWRSQKGLSPASVRRRPRQTSEAAVEAFGSRYGRNSVPRRGRRRQRAKINPHAAGRPRDPAASAACRKSIPPLPRRKRAARRPLKPCRRAPCGDAVPAGHAWQRASSRARSPGKPGSAEGMAEGFKGHRKGRGRRRGRMGPRRPMKGSIRPIRPTTANGYCNTGPRPLDRRRSSSLAAQRAGVRCPFPGIGVAFGGLLLPFSVPPVSSARRRERRAGRLARPAGPAAGRGQGKTIASAGTGKIFPRRHRGCRPVRNPLLHNELSKGKKDGRPLLSRLTGGGG